MSSNSDTSDEEQPTQDESEGSVQNIFVSKTESSAVVDKDKDDVIRTSDESEGEDGPSVMADQSQESVLSQDLPANAQVQDYSSFLDQMAADSPAGQPSSANQEAEAAQATSDAPKTTEESAQPSDDVIDPVLSETTPLLDLEEKPSRTFEPEHLTSLGSAHVCAECGENMQSDQHYW